MVLLPGNDSIVVKSVFSMKPHNAACDTGGTYFGCFVIDVDGFTWICGPEDDPEDLCFHGHVTVRIGEMVLEYDGTVIATALYLLKNQLARLQIQCILWEKEEMLWLCHQLNGRNLIFYLHDWNDYVPIDRPLGTNSSAC